LGSFATVAGGVMAAFIGMGVSAEHLMAASVMAAPCALAMSKISCPETEQSKTAKGVAFVVPKGDAGVCRLTIASYVLRT
jgi:CNT family concentrative nucleoside transporter